MSTAAGGIPRAAWLAAGAAVGAAVTWAGLPAAIALAGGLAVTAVGSAPRVPERRRAGITAAGLGAALVALRVMALPASPAGPSIAAAGSGPWTAAVESVGSPKDGAQLARLDIASDAGPVIVAATLPAFPVVAAGAVVEVGGRLEPPPPDDPYGEYLQRTGAAGSLRADTLRVLRPPPATSLQTFRDGAGDALRGALPEPEAGLAAGILIGLRERVDRGLAADFATAGVSHVVAISGWNIAIVAGTVGALMRGRPRRLVAIVVGATVVAYVVAAGASPSVVRAAVMAGIVLVARETGRAGRAPAVLGLATAFLLLIQPALIGDAGFRLSVLATAGLLAWATQLGAWLRGVGGGRLPGWLAESLGISLAAQAATLPDVLATFGRLSLVAPVVNLVVVPIVPAAMAGGLVAMIAGWLVTVGAPPLLGVVAGLPGWLLLHVMVAVVRIAAGLPFAAVALPPDAAVPAGVAAAAGLFGAVVALRRWGSRRGRRRRRRRARVAPARVALSRTARANRHRRRPLTPVERAALVVAAVALAAGTLAAADLAGRQTRIVVLDVGQGDAILVESRDGARMLVDGGPDPDRLLLELDAHIAPWDRRLDVVVLTHPHEDHVAGLVRVLERYRVGRVFEPGMRGSGPGWAAWDAALRHGPPRATLAAGAHLWLGEIRLDVLWPEPGTVPAATAPTGSGINDTSIVLLGEAGSRRFLLTGDAEEGVDPALIARGLPRVDVLKIAHHGSATATTAALLEATRPSIGLISVGAGNDYGHPAPSTLARLSAARVRVYRTDQDGTIEADLAPDGVTIRTARPGRTASAMITGYDPPHDHPGAPRDRPPAALPGPARLVPAALVRRGGRGRVPGPAGGRDGQATGCRRGRGRVAAPRRGQAPVRGGARPPPPRRRLRGVAGGSRPAGAGPAGPRPPGHAPRRGRARRLGGDGLPRGEDRRLLGQAGGPAARGDGRAVRLVAPPVPGGPERARDPRDGRTARIGLGRWGRGHGPRPGTGAGARRVCGRGRRAGRSPAAALVPSRPAGGGLVSRDVPVVAYCWGDDGWTIDRTVIGMARAMERDSGAAPERWRVSGRETTPGAIGEHVSTAPMFGGGTLAVVTDPGPLVRSKAGKEALERVIAAVAPGNALVFVELGDGNDRKRAASLKALEAVVVRSGGSARGFRAPQAGELVGWVGGRAAELGMTLEPAAARELATRVGAFVREGDVDRQRMGALAVSELEKLSLYRIDGPVTVDDVRALVPEAIPDSTWAFLDAVAERRAAQAAPLLDRLLEVTPEPVILVQLHRRLRDLLLAADHAAGGGSPAALVKLMGGHPYRVEKTADQSRAWAPEELVAALEGLLELDAMTKGVGTAGATDRQRRMAWVAWVGDRVARGGGRDGGARDGH